MVWWILLIIYGSLNIFMIAYTGYLCGDEDRKLHIWFPFLTVYEDLRETYTVVGALIPTILMALCMVIHVIFVTFVNILAFILGIFEGLWCHLFRKR